MKKMKINTRNIFRRKTQVPPKYSLFCKMIFFCILPLSLTPWFCTSSYPERIPPDQVLLNYPFQTNQEFKFKIHMAQTAGGYYLPSDGEAEEISQVETIIDFVLTIKVDQVVNQESTLLFSYKELQGFVNVGEMKRSLNESLSELKNIETIINIDREGNILDISFRPDYNPRQFANLSNFKQFYTYLFSALPSGLIEVGDDWTVEETIPIFFESQYTLDLEVRMECEFTQIKSWGEGYLAEILSEGQIGLYGDYFESDARISIPFETSVYQGAYEINLQDGFIQNYKTSMDFQADTRVGEQNFITRQSIVMEMNRIQPTP